MKPPKNNNLVILGARGKLSPMRAISLLEIMREFIASNIIVLENNLDVLIDEIHRKGVGTEFTKREIHDLDFSLNDLPFQENELKAMGWEGAAHRLEELRDLINEKKNLKEHRKIFKISLTDLKAKKFPSPTEVLHHLEELRSLVDDELVSRKFVMLDGKKADFFEQRNLVGKQVSKCFPSAKDEIKAAGNCLALDLNTAAVFHLIRTAEYGMRALALHLKVKLTHKGKPKPIEHGGWDEIINHIENKIQERREKYDKSVKKNRRELEFLKFCRIVAAELYKFKEHDRNDTMHSIRSYNESEAKGVFDRVRDFMQRLSKEVSEK